MELGNMVFGHSRGEVEIPRGRGYEDMLIELAMKLPGGEDSRGYGVNFSNDVFEMHPYCWCEKDDCPQCGTGEQFNFLYKPTGYGIRWYKYMLRDAYATAEISLLGFCEMIDACLKSIRAAGEGI
jgi:hypothetical protein